MRSDWKLTVLFELSTTIRKESIVHSLSSGKVEMFLCESCHAFTPYLNE